MKQKIHIQALGLLISLALITVGSASVENFSETNFDYELGGALTDAGFASFEGDYDFPQREHLQPKESTSKPAWEHVNPMQEPEQYGDLIFDYLLEGYGQLIERNSASSATEKWYHMPWRHTGRSGREAISGLTRTVPFFSRRISPRQRTGYQNWSQSIYNSTAGSALAEVWQHGEAPKLSGFVFPKNSVMVQLVYTEAPERLLGFWNEALTLAGHVYESQRSSTREIKDLRLIEIHFAVKDPRSPIGWFFGSFRYEYNAETIDPLERFHLMGLSWGNGDEVKGDPQHWVNQPVLSAERYPVSTGEGGSYVGFTKDTRSSCVSCHGTAQAPLLSPMIVPSTLPAQLQERWFRNLPPGTSFDGGAESADYSFGLALAIEAYRDANPETRSSQQPPAERWLRSPILMDSDPQ